jgi:hypothetical protein
MRQELLEKRQTAVRRSKIKIMRDSVLPPARYADACEKTVRGASWHRGPHGSAVHASRRTHTRTGLGTHIGHRFA